MKDRCYLVLSEDGGIVSMKKRPPSLKGNERAIIVEVIAPSEFFEYNFITKTVEIEKDDMIEPDVEVQIRHSVNRL